MTQHSTILLVEDDPAAVQIALHAFTKSGVKKEQISVARNGQEALDLLFKTDASESHKPSLVLLDLKLPKIDGLEVLKEIRETEATKDIPVIILTNSDEERDVTQGYDLGANSYLRKPVDYLQLIELLIQLGLIPE
ncbi:MAG: response regulator [Magnetococcales bacterium]|nr:response regulator [Magnetococcales bacterium]